MAASKLLQIYEALSNYAVLVDGENIPCRKLGDAAVIDLTPTRILSPLSERNEAQGFVPLSFGGASTLQWIITDLCLMASVGQGSGIEFWVPQLVKYQAAYVENVFAQRNLGLGVGITVNGVAPEIGEYSYPLGTDHWYYGAKMVWTIRENLG